MKTCLSDFGKYKYIRNNYKLCPYSCCTCYIIECCCCCHCSCHIKKQKKIPSPKVLTYSLMSTATDNNTQNEAIPLENNNNNKSNNILNLYGNTNKNLFLKKHNSLTNINRSKNVLFLKNDLIKETKKIKNEINDLKSKLKIEKENISKILKSDFSLINNRINMKKNENKNKENNRKNISNIIMGIPKGIKKIYLPKKMDSSLRSNSNNKKLNKGVINHQLIHTNNNNYLNTNRDFNNNKINEEDLNKEYLNYKINFKGLNKNENISCNQSSSPPLNDIELNPFTKTKFYSSYYPAANNDISSYNYRKKYSPFRTDDNFNVHNHIPKNNRNNRILSFKTSFTTYHPNDNLKYDNNSVMNSGSNSRNNRNEKLINDSFYNSNDYRRNKVHEMQLKNPICLNSDINNKNISKNIFDRNRKLYYSNSYENKNDIFKNRVLPLNKYQHSFLSHRKYNYNSKDNHIKRIKDFYNKYLNKNKIISIPRNNYLFKSKSNENFHKKNNNNIKVNNNNILYSKKNVNSNLKTDKLKTSDIINEKNKSFDNKDSNKDLDSKDILFIKSGNEFFRISPERNNLIIHNQSFSINKCKEEKSKKCNIELKNKYKNNFSSVPFLKKNKCSSLIKSINNTNIKSKSNNQDELLPSNKKYSYVHSSKDEDNIVTQNSFTNNFTDIIEMGKSEENNIFYNNNNNRRKEIKSNILAKMNIDTNLSLDDEMNSYYHNKLKLKKNINISNNTIFTLYKILNKIFILCFDFTNKKFSLRDFVDFGKFEENYKLSLQTKSTDKSNISNGNLLLSKGPNLYIITGKNHDMLYEYDSIKKTMNNLCGLKNNHSNGALIDLGKNNLLCISGDFNKKVELFSISKNNWIDYLPETLIERSNCAFTIIKKRYIFLLFGKNYPTNEYLNTIEYYDINNNNNINDKNSNGWKYLRYKNCNNLIIQNVRKKFSTCNSSVK